MKLIHSFKKMRNKGFLGAIPRSQPFHFCNCTSIYVDQKPRVSAYIQVNNWLGINMSIFIYKKYEHTNKKKKKDFFFDQM